LNSQKILDSWIIALLYLFYSSIKNKFVDKIVDFATCVDKTGKRYNIELDSIMGFEDDFEK
jgi:hypothetical protein